MLYCLYKCLCFRDMQSPHSLSVSKVRKTREGKCTCSLALSWGLFGVFVLLHKKSGNKWHVYHPQTTDPECMPLPLRLLSKEKVEATLHATDAAKKLVDFPIVPSWLTLIAK